MPSPVELLPHAPPMVLLDEIVDWSEGKVIAAVTVGDTTRFLRAGQGVPAHVGIEWMAQTCGAFAGLEAQAAGEPVRLGFLLGTRHYRALRPYFAEGERVEVRANLVLREGSMGVFDCRIRDAAGVELASAQLTVFQPGDEDSIPAVMG